MNEYDIQVDLEHGLVFHIQIDLVQNDYNSTIFNFKFNDKDYSKYIKVFQLEYPDGKTWTKEIKEDKITLADLTEDGNYIPILTQSGKYYFDIAIYDENSKLTTTKKSYFKVREKITGEDIELDDRVPILDDLINNVTKGINEISNIKEQGDYAKEQGDYAKEQGKKIENVVVDLEDIKNVAEQANDKSDTAISISKGANQALSYDSYELMVTNFNAFEQEKFNLGQQIMIRTLNVPDLWVYEYANGKIEYEYTDDETIVNLLTEQGYIQVGWYLLAQLETQKVDLTEYVKDTDYATSSKGGTVKIDANGRYGIGINSYGVVFLQRASESEIDAKTSTNKAIVPSTINHSVGSVLPVMTQAEYDALETKDENLYYFIVEE